MIESEASFNLACFDDDFESIENLRTIHEYYEYLETKDFLELNWKCPGKKNIQKPTDDTPKVSTPSKESQNAKQSQQQEFDFQDEADDIGSSKFGSTPKRTTKKTSTPRAAPNTFSNIMNKMKKSQAKTPK